MIGIPFVLVIIEWLALRGELLREFIAQHAFQGGFFSRLSGGIGELYQQLLSLEVLLSLVLSALLLYGAIYFRGKADEL